jgi:hypothetical protein
VGKLVLKGAPEWMRYMVYGFVGYAFVNFAPILFLTLLVGTPVRAQEAVAVELKEKVHTVSTEEFRSDDGVHRELTGSTVDLRFGSGPTLSLKLLRARDLPEHARCVSRENSC